MFVGFVQRHREGGRRGDGHSARRTGKHDLELRPVRDARLRLLVQNLVNDVTVKLLVRCQAVLVVRRMPFDVAVLTGQLFAEDVHEFVSAPRQEASRAKGAAARRGYALRLHLLHLLQRVQRAAVPEATDAAAGKTQLVGVEGKGAEAMRHCQRFEPSGKRWQEPSPKFEGQRTEIQMRILAGTALSLLLAACTPTGEADMAAAPDPMISQARLKDMTQTLSSDAFEGRAPMTAGETKTIEYLAAQMEEAGLQPGNNGSWYQKVPLVEVAVDESSADITLSGQGLDGTVLDYGSDQVVWTKRIEENISVDNSELVFVGYGIVAPERGWNDYEGIDMAGKTAVILVNDPDWETEGLEGPFGGRAMTYYGRWTYKYEEAARQGADGAIIIHETEPAAYGWQTVESSWSGPQIEMDRADRGAGRVAVEGWLQKPVAERIVAAAGQDLAELTVRAQSGDLSPVPLGVTMSASLENTIRRGESNNVIGILPGAERPDEYVLYTAHWDHLGRCAPDEADQICNGAFDNATGTAGLVELGRAHAAAGASDRSIVFLAVTAEESGLLGSAYYAANPVYPLSQTVGGLNMDGLSVYGETNDVVVIGAGKSELEDYLEEEVLAQGRRIDVEPSPEKGYFYRSDHFSLAKQGVPMLYAEGGVDLVAGGRERGQQLADDYTANRYHLPGDEYDPNWNWDGAVQDLMLNYRIGRALADSEAWPNWYEGDEFRRIRDESRAGAE